MHLLAIYVKSREIEDSLRIGVELKPFERKLDFWNLFKIWSIENYLKFGVLGIKFKNWNFGNQIGKKLEFLKLFEN